MALVAVVIILLAAVAVFALQNAHLVPVTLLGWQFDWPLAGVVLVTVAAGALLVFLTALIRQVGLSLKVRDASGRLRKAENELAQARSEMEKIRAEIGHIKVALAEKDQDLVALRAELAAKTRELEEARKLAAATAPDGGARGGGGRGAGTRRG